MGRCRLLHHRGERRTTAPLEDAASGSTSPPSCERGRGAPQPNLPLFVRARGTRPLPHAIELVLQNANRPPLAGGAEVHFAGTRREDRVIAPEPGALARPELGPALAHDDLAAADLLARENLHAQHLRVRFAAVATGAQPLLMSHRSPPSQRVFSRRPVFWPPI